MSSDPVKYISVIDVKAGMDAGRSIVVIDARNPDEFAAGNVPGSINIPIPDLAAELARVTAGAPELVVATCGSTGRGEKAAHILSECGINDVMVLEGGLRAWREAGLEVNEPPQS